MGLYHCGGDKLQGSVHTTGWKDLPQGTRAFGHGPLQRREAAVQDWGYRECLVLLPGDGAAGGLTCRSWGTKGPGAGAVGGDQQDG